MILTATDQEALFSLLQDLVRTPSLSGEEEACARLLQRRMAEFGFDDIGSDRFGNVIGKITFPRPGPTLLLEAHLDHVGVSDVERWTHYPYGGERAEGRIWGRGTVDNKGALAAMVVAASLAAAAPERLTGTLYVVGSVHNELLEGAVLAGITEICRPDYVIIGEASDHLIMYGQRGRAELILETKGRSTLTAMAHQGVNAVSQMLRLIAELENRRRSLPAHPELGQIAMELTSIASAPHSGVNVIPDKCLARFDWRFPMGETRSGMLANIQEAIDSVSRRDSSFEARVSLAEKEYRCYTGVSVRSEVFMPAWLCPRDHPLVAAVCRGVYRAGVPVNLSVYPFSTNGSYYAGVLGIPTVGFGPSAMDSCHMDNEYIDQKGLINLCGSYYSIVQALLGAGRL